MMSYKAGRVDSFPAREVGDVFSVVVDVLHAADKVLWSS